MKFNIKIFYGILCTFLFGIALCFSVAMPKQSLETVTEYTQKEKDKVADCNVNYAALIQQQNENCMVQIKTIHFLGSGVIYRMDDKFLWVLTAAHVLKDWQGACIVIFSDDYSVACNEVIFSKEADLAFLKIPYVNEEKSKNADQLKDHLAFYEAVSKEKVAFDRLENEAGVVACGSAKGVAENAYEGKVLQAFIYTDDFSQYMLIANVYVTPGMSGGGLFDLNGNFLGILAGVDLSGEECKTAVVPLSIILAEESLLLQ